MFTHIWSMTVFTVQWQSLTVPTETMWLAKPQLFTTWPFTDHFSDSCTALYCLLHLWATFNKQRNDNQYGRRNKTPAFVSIIIAQTPDKQGLIH